MLERTLNMLGNSLTSRKDQKYLRSSNPQNLAQVNKLGLTASLTVGLIDLWLVITSPWFLKRNSKV